MPQNNDTIVIRLNISKGQLSSDDASFQPRSIIDTHQIPVRNIVSSKLIGTFDAVPVDKSTGTARAIIGNQSTTKLKRATLSITIREPNGTPRSSNARKLCWLAT